LLKKGVEMMRAMFAVFVLLLGVSLPSTLVAQVPKRSVRLDLATDLIRFQFGGWNPAGPEDWRHTRLSAGIGNPNVKVGLGVTVADALTVGLHFAIGYDKGETKLDEEDSKLEEEEVTTDFDAMTFSEFRWGAMPYLEYAFLSNVLRPFIMFTLGFEGEIDETTYEKTTYWDFVFGLGGGVHLFVSPAVSIDLGLLLGFTAGGGSTEITGEEEPVKERFTRILFRLNGGLGISGWF
jgi:hypothetical protein